MKNIIHSDIVIESLKSAISKMEADRKATLKSLEPIIIYAKRAFEIYQHQQEAFQYWIRLDKELTKALVQHGWFISPEGPTYVVYELDKIKEKEGIEGVIKALIDTFSLREHIEEVYKYIISSPITTHRKHIINDAFTAHIEGRYNLSVPVFLIQAEGIFNEYTGAYILKSEDVKKKKYLKNYLKNSKDTYASLIDGFEGFIEFAYKHYGIKDTIPPLILNRHTIVHGRTLDYGTIENSIKAILFIEYVVSLIGLNEKSIKKVDS